MKKNGMPDLAGFMVMGVALAGLSAGAPAMAQAGNHSPVCYPKSTVITEAGVGVAAIEINPISAGPACSDADGDRLSLTYVSPPAVQVLDKDGQPTNELHFTNTLSSGQSAVIQFTVSDGHGGTATSTMTITSQDQGQ